MENLNSHISTARNVSREQESIGANSMRYSTIQPRLGIAYRKEMFSPNTGALSGKSQTWRSFKLIKKAV